MKVSISIDELAELTSKFARKHVPREVVEASLGAGIPSPFYNMDPIISLVLNGEEVTIDPILVRFVRTLAHLIEK